MIERIEQRPVVDRSEAPGRPSAGSVARTARAGDGWLRLRKRDRCAVPAVTGDTEPIQLEPCPETWEERGRRATRGAVLLTCLVLLAALLAAGATSLWLTRSELWAAGNARAARQARHTAEAGVLHALAVMGPGASFGALLAGTGGLADPARPGPMPLAGGGWVEFPGPPFGYGVSLVDTTPAADGSPRLLVDAVATAVRGARHGIRATVGRSPEPYAPAGLVVASGRLSFAGSAVGTAALPGVVLDGRLARRREEAALAATTVAGTASARAASEAASAGLLGARGATVARGFDVRAFVSESGLVSQPLGLLDGAVGSDQSPAGVRVEPGDAARLTGAGIVAVDGDLTVVGETGWKGVLLVTGRVRFEGSPCRVSGMVWAEDAEFAAPCEIVLDPSAVALADGMLHLPRLPVLLALADVTLD